MFVTSERLSAKQLLSNWAAGYAVTATWCEATEGTAVVTAVGGICRGEGAGEAKSSNQPVEGFEGAGLKMLTGGEKIGGDELEEDFGLLGPGGPEELRTMSGAEAQQTVKVERMYTGEESARGLGRGGVCV
ncbi:hypothetical protein AX14_006490 [Amanita brunnescens Koide BX004]|nr:hypothetical protein AX14_006490 [Amanita brunnescens Koide BX004]